MRGSHLSASPSATVTLYVGTYTDGAGQGLYRADFNPETGELGEAVLALVAVNPTFLVWHPRLPVLYVVRETDDGPEHQGALIALAVSADGGVTVLNQQPSGGAGPCHVSIDAGGAHLFTANYHGGSVAAFPLDADGAIRAASSVVRHSGSSVDPVRQRKPYAHAMEPAPDGPFVLAADLGIDCVMVYRVNAAGGRLTPHDAGPDQADTGAAGTDVAGPGSVMRAAPGAGPRHLAFAPAVDDAGRLLFVINELDSTIATYLWDGARGTLTPHAAPVSTLPAGFTGTNITAEIAVHPGGRFLYGSNRGHDSIAIFRIDAEGRPVWAGCQPTGGATPRHFAIDPGGTFLIAANQDSGSFVVFRIDPGTGLLSETGISASVPSPACLSFRPPPAIDHT